MKKFRIMIGVVIAAILSAGVLAACTPEIQGPINYEVTPLADLADFGDPSSTQFYFPTPLKYVSSMKKYDGNDATTQLNQLSVRIADEKLSFENEDADQSTFQKILAFSNADQVLETLAYAALPYQHMVKLVEYVAGSGNEDFFSHYKLIQDAQEIMDKNADTSAEYQDAYKVQQRTRRKMFDILEKTGMTGDEAGRTIIQASAYAEKVVVDEMIPANMPALVGQEYALENYFKALVEKGGLFDYDALVTFKTNDSIRTTIKSAENRQYTEDPQLVRAYGYLYQYQIASNKALDNTDFNKELDYHFKTVLEDAEAKDFARIQGLSYTLGYRYSDKFYREKFHPAVNVVNLAQEKVEAEVYEINEKCKLTDGKRTVNGDGTIAKEPNIVINLSTEIKIANKIVYASEMQLKGVQNGIESDLLAGDMQYYYARNTDYKNSVSMARYQKQYELVKDKGASQKAPAQLSLQKENLKMTQFIIGQFIERENKQGLSKSLVGQIYAVAADDIMTVNQLKKDIVIMLAELDGIELATNPNDYYEKAVKIGRKNAQLKQFVNAASKVVSTAEAQVNIASANTEWDVIHTEITTAIDFDYSVYKVSEGTYTPQLSYMQYLLVKQTFTEGGVKKPYIPGISMPGGGENANVQPEYDTEHRISRLLSNHEKVLYHSASIIQVQFKKVSDYTSDKGIDTFTFGDWKKITIESGETLKTGEGWGVGKKDYPLAAESVGAEVRAAKVPSNYVFKGWYLDPDGYYKIDYDENVRYDETMFYAVFKA